MSTKANASDILGVLGSYAEDGTVHENALGRIAAQMGIEPTEAMSRFEALKDAFTEQAYATVAKSGHDPEAVFEWAQKANPKALSAAIQAHATRRNVTGYQDIVKSYVSELDSIDPDSILNAQFGQGVTARRDRNTGDIVISALGTEMSWKTAVRRGLLKIGKSK